MVGFDILHVLSAIGRVNGGCGGGGGVGVLGVGGGNKARQQSLVGSIALIGLATIGQCHAPPAKL